MTRLFILQVLLFFDWLLLSNGDDASEEPSHDRFVLHIPIPITTLKHTHAVFKITQNNGKKHHDLEIYPPVQHSVSNHHHKSSSTPKHKHTSKKRTQQSVKTSKNEQKQTRKGKHHHDESNDDQHHHLSIGFGSTSQNKDPENRLQELFDHYFRTDRKYNHNLKVNYKEQEKIPGFVFRHGSRAGRSQNSNHDHNQFSHDHFKRSRNDRHKQDHKNKKRGRLKNSTYGHTDREEDPDTDAQQEEDVENSDFKVDDASFNLKSGVTRTPYVSIKTKLPRLHPNWADEGLISPFALNDVLFKDKKYNKKVFKELGWYPLFLPYEVEEEQEKR